MEINTHDSEVFVSATERPQVTFSVYAAVGIGALLFGAGYLVGRVTKKPILAVPDLCNQDLEGGIDNMN